MTFNSYRRENATSNQYKFNGIEEQDELDLNVYGAFFRTMDPTIGRWWQIDPKAEGYLSWTPFNAMGNNPVLIMDPLGDDWLTDRDRKESDRLKTSIGSKTTKLEEKNKSLSEKAKQAGSDGKTGKVLKIENKISANKERIGELGKSTRDLVYMDDPNTTLFTFEKVQGESGETSIKRKDVGGVMKPVIVMGHLGSDANKVHEARHGYEIAKHTIPTFAGMIDGSVQEPAEVSAYQAQFAFDPSSMPASKGGSPGKVSDVNGYYVGGIMNSNGKPTYGTTNKKYVYK